MSSVDGRLNFHVSRNRQLEGQLFFGTFSSLIFFGTLVVAYSLLIPLLLCSIQCFMSSLCTCDVLGKDGSGFYQRGVKTHFFVRLYLCKSQ
jgi:hypothetical protein